MKILVFTSLYPNNEWPHHGVFIKERMTRVAKLEGCQVQVVAPVPYFPPLKLTSRWRFSQVLRREIIEGLEVYHPRYFMTPRVGMASYGVTMFLSVLSAVKKTQRRFDFDLIDAHYVYPDGFAAVLLGRYFKRPVVVSARGSDINQFSAMPFIRVLLQHTLQKSQHVIAVCQALKDAMTQLGIAGEKISVVPNGVDLNKFHPIPKGEARGKLGISNNKRIILSVGGLIPRKGFDLLIRAFKILLAATPRQNLSLVIVGEGPYERALKDLVSSLHLEQFVHFAGDVHHQDLYHWYNAADLFCLASSREGWPNVLMESLACGTPVVATEVGGMREIVVSDRLGLLRERTPEGLAAGIKIALEKPWRATDLVQYARSYTWGQVARSMFSIFASVLNGKPINENLVSSSNPDGRCSRGPHLPDGPSIP